MRQSARRCSWCERVGSSLLGSWAVGRLSLTLALRHLLHFFLHRSARHTRGPLGLGRRFLACRALQLLPFCFIGNILRIHALISPAYFSTSFLSPYRGKLTVILASSPSPSR